MEFSEEYIKNYGVDKIVEDLNRMKKSLDSLILIYSKRKKLDIETKKNIFSMYFSFHEIQDIEINKELSKQHSEGKEFLSADEIDEIVEKVKKENGL